MHYQTVIKGSDVKEVRFAVSNNTSNGVAYLPEFNEKLFFMFTGDHTIRVVQEEFDGDIKAYQTSQFFNFPVLPFLVSAVCFKYGIRYVEVGLSTHSVAVFDTEGSGRFIPTTESGKIYLHDREGMVFTQEGQYFTAVSNEQVAEMLISNMDYSLRFFDQKYLIRFKVGNRFIYFPLADVFTDSGMRSMKHRNIPEVDKVNWGKKLDEILAMPDQFTKPRK